MFSLRNRIQFDESVACVSQRNENTGHSQAHSSHLNLSRTCLWLRQAYTHIRRASPRRCSVERSWSSHASQRNRHKQNATSTKFFFSRFYGQPLFPFVRRSYRNWIHFRNENRFNVQSFFPQNEIQKQIEILVLFFLILLLLMIGSFIIQH